ncbi:uncharacterized protein LOC122569468 [Bombus pyrosoma]|uniref:uncharacterized protein LOC122569468 n=1 Tax=Bombus pyrosoma TaxID=396416 RepID=UPI001CB9B0CF|nr:uncharacterized protein LOC122569468 [Bombus pyrosoma]XP_043586489.1 uncharacterized protein LOC122569468 [Bombus pyrosoma]XP_043586490.1 uncharacterized protein LOC122569468 [Bombus pyrosoma]
MTMSRRNEKEDLKILQELIPNATPESLRIFRDCMRIDALYNAALPYGIISAAATHMLIPKTQGMLKPIATAVIGVTMSLVGKLLYTPKCYQKAFGTVEPFTRRQLHHADNVNRQEQQSKYLVSSTDNLQEEEPVWDNIDTQFESYPNEFDDISGNSQEESTNEQQGKKRVTYDDLWMQHREQQMKNQYSDIQNYFATNNARREPVRRQQTRLPQKSAVPETEFDEKETWN